MYSKLTPQLPPIARGGACNNCKRRKMRCDGARPICRACSKSESFGDCEYAEVGRTYADRLQEQINALEARLEELQNPNSSSNALALYDPYVSSSSVMSRAGTSSGTGIIQGSPQSRSLEKALMEAFLPYASQLGFFLNARNLIRAFSNPFSHDIQQPTSALAAAMVLLSSTFSGDPNVTAVKEVYLSNAVQAASFGLSENHPQKIIHSIQTHVLIAHYFFLQARALEGRWHLNNAVSLILSARMHRIRSSQINDVPTFTVHATILPPIRNVVEEGERINTMWTVLALNCLWSAVEGVPAFISYTTEPGRVDTPWPLDFYSDTAFPPDLRNSHTLQKFLADIPDNGHSTLALYVKAAVLFEQTTGFWKRYWHPESRVYSEMEGFHSNFEKLRSLLTRLLSEIPPVGQQVSSEAKNQLLVIHTLVRATMIKLYSTFGAEDPSYSPIFLDMTEGIVKCFENIDTRSITFVDPIMAVLLKIPAQVCIGTIRQFRSSSNYNAAAVQNNIDLLGKLVKIMNHYSEFNLFMAANLVEIQASYASEH